MPTARRAATRCSIRPACAAAATASAATPAISDALKNAGAGFSDNTKSLTYTLSGDSKSFCIAATSTADNTFHITDAGGVVSGGC